MGDAARSGGAGFGDIVHGDAVGELDAFDELGQLIPPVQPPHTSASQLTNAVAL